MENLCCSQEAQNSHVYWVSSTFFSVSVGNSMWSGPQGQSHWKLTPATSPALLYFIVSINLCQQAQCINTFVCVVFLQWRYCIRLENMGNEVVQLRERHWRIFSLSGTLETVRGRGVVGRVCTTHTHTNAVSKTTITWTWCHFIFFKWYIFIHFLSSLNITNLTEHSKNTVKSC